MYNVGSRKLSYQTNMAMNHKDCKIFYLSKILIKIDSVLKKRTTLK